MDGGASKEKSKLPEDKKSVTWVVISLTMDELKVQSMVIDIDRSKWELPSNRLPQRHHSAEEQTAIRSQVEALLKLDVIEESRAAHGSQVHPVLIFPEEVATCLRFREA